MPDRINVQKTYKTYINGKFQRTESGRYYKVFGDADCEVVVANACRCSRKDVRDAVVAARKAQNGWAERSAYNRGQILYRIAEMLEGRKRQFINELKIQSFDHKTAQNEVEKAIDTLIYYAGWADKYQQVFSSVNPVASNHFNFSMLEPTGVVAVLAPEKSSLQGLASVIAPVIAGGNSCIALASEDYPLPAISFAEVLHSSDVPAGVVNILTGFREELIPHLSSHMDVNALFFTDPRVNKKYREQIDENAALNIKRIVYESVEDWNKFEADPYIITKLNEVKTTWHPAGF